jgi:hypothetical protein
MDELYDYCFYHANCPDGFFSAVIMSGTVYHGSRRCFPIDYDDQMDVVSLALTKDSIRNEDYVKTAIFVDFCPSDEVIASLFTDNVDITILDHHESEKDRLLTHIGLGAVTGRYGVGVSGVGLAWEHRFRDAPLPEFFECVQDRDLWLYNNVNTKALMECIRSMLLDFETHKGLNHVLSYSVKDMVKTGNVLLDATRTAQSTILKQTIRVSLDGTDRICHCINCPPIWASDIGHKLNEMYPGDGLSMTYFIRPKDVKISLRSGKDGIDVSEVAKHYGGGGHFHSAGAVTTLNILKELISNSKT